MQLDEGKRGHISSDFSYGQRFSRSYFDVRTEWRGVFTRWHNRQRSSNMPRRRRCPSNLRATIVSEIQCASSSTLKNWSSVVLWIQTLSSHFVLWAIKQFLFFKPVWTGCPKSQSDWNRFDFPVKPMNRLNRFETGWNRFDANRCHPYICVE